MALGGQMNDRVWLIFRQHPVQAVSVADVQLPETVIGMIDNRIKRSWIGRIGQFVDIHHMRPVLQHELTTHGRPDKSGTTCHQYSHVTPHIYFERMSKKSERAYTRKHPTELRRKIRSLEQQEINQTNHAIIQIKL
jgi:hypothetical protein